MKVTRNELQKLLDDLWESDENRCSPEIEYSLNLQGRLMGKETGLDLAKKNLFNYFDEERVFARPTYKLFRDLLDNYEIEIGIPEITNQKEIKENNDFLDAIFETKVIDVLHKFLVKHKLAPENSNHFKSELNKLWFHFYKRSRVLDSSGFEHVFVGEIKGQQIIGMHNWIQIYFQEKNGNIDYKGYFQHKTSHESSSPRVITIQFTWRNGKAKPMGSSLVGTSPEFEIALFTAMHYCNVINEGRVKIGGNYVDLIHHQEQGDIKTSYIVGKD